jgi:hypothetical protein
MDSSRRRLLRAGVGGAFAVGAAAWLPHPLLGQQQFELYVAPFDKDGLPVRDLRAEEIEIAENGAAGRVVRIEPFRWPIKLTVLVDNGPQSVNALTHFRTGLTRLFAALPSDLEVSLVATAPNPRWLTRPTTDRIQIAKGVSLLTPDDDLQRTNEALMEYAERLDRDFAGVNAERGRPYLPALICIGGSGFDASSTLRDPLVKMVNSLTRYGVMTRFVVLTPGITAGVNAGAHAVIARAVQQSTKGRYEAIADSNALLTLLPEWGRQLAARHVRQTSQYRVTIERPSGARGLLNDPEIAIARPGLNAIFTMDGQVPDR